MSDLLVYRISNAFVKLPEPLKGEYIDLFNSMYQNIPWKKIMKKLVFEFLIINLFLIGNIMYYIKAFDNSHAYKDLLIILAGVILPSFIILMLNLKIDDYVHSLTWNSLIKKDKEFTEYSKTVSKTLKNTKRKRILLYINFKNREF